MFEKSCENCRFSRVAGRMFLALCPFEPPTLTDLHSLGDDAPLARKPCVTNFKPWHVHNGHSVFRPKGVFIHAVPVAQKPISKRIELLAKVEGSNLHEDQERQEKAWQIPCVIDSDSALELFSIIWAREKKRKP